MLFAMCSHACEYFVLTTYREKNMPMIGRICRVDEMRGKWGRAADHVQQPRGDERPAVLL